MVKFISYDIWQECEVVTDVFHSVVIARQILSKAQIFVGHSLKNPTSYFLCPKINMYDTLFTSDYNDYRLYS